jgi:hypothetical protein
MFVEAGVKYSDTGLLGEKGEPPALSGSQQLACMASPPNPPSTPPPLTTTTTTTTTT